VAPAEKTSLDDLALEALVLWDQPPGAAVEGEGASEPLATCAAPRSVLSQGTALSPVLRARCADPCSLRGAAPPAAPAPDAEGEAAPAPASEAEQQPAGRGAKAPSGAGHGTDCCRCSDSGFDSACAAGAL
jgi:hypothetical protein